MWPLLASVTLPLSVVTLGMAGLVLNGALVALAAKAAGGADRSARAWCSLGLAALTAAALTAVLSALLAIDDDEAWQRNVVRRQARRRGERTASDVPGVVFLQIDGLAHEVLVAALRDGHVPTLARWLRAGTHRLVRWETDWSSQTGACQAGLLHGDNDDMPAFRWWRRERGAAIVTNHPKDAAELERRRSDGRGLLHAGGASRANILSGDATHSMLTMSTVLLRRRPIGRDYSAYFVRPYAAARGPSPWCWRTSLASATRPPTSGGLTSPRVPRCAATRSSARGPPSSSATCRSRPSSATCWPGARSSTRPPRLRRGRPPLGVERPDTLAVLSQVDRQLARLEAAVADAPRPYRLVVLSDHGQSQGETFLQRYGVSLEELVRSACEATDVHFAAGEDEAVAYMSAGLTEVARDDTLAARTVRSATRGRRADEAVALDARARREIERTHGAAVPTSR